MTAAIGRPAEAALLKIYLADGSCSNVKCDNSTTVRNIIRVIVSRFDGSAVDIRPYALCVFPLHKEPLQPEDISWLHNNWTVEKVFQQWPVFEDFKVELRVRYMSNNLEDMFRNQMATFYYLYDQVKKDFLVNLGSGLQLDVALELGCLEIRRFLKDMSLSSFEKKSNFEILVTEIGLDRFFPKSVIMLQKPKPLRKSALAFFKKYATLSESECIIRFLTLLKEFVRYDTESFKCFLGSGCAVSVDLVIGPEHGVSYTADKKRIAIKLVDFEDLQSIRTNQVSNDTLKGVVTLQVATTSEPLVISCSSASQADSIAQLIDGYQAIFNPNRPDTIWIQEDDINASFRSSFGIIPNVRTQTVDIYTAAPETESGFNELEKDIDADYAALTRKNSELNRQNVSLEKLLGEGQFGDVYKAQYELTSGAKMPVAVKICKIESEAEHGSSFLEEACMILHLIEILVDNIAARNVLVFGPQEVKLSDFGLSRQVDSQSFYTASKGKLPIKWMAPESINFRRFTHASDVWMFGVAIWEILSLGIKPFQGIRNHEVIHKIEHGERLPIPVGCPIDLYDLMLEIWSYEPDARPKMCDVKILIQEILTREKNFQCSPSKKIECRDRSVERSRVDSSVHQDKRRSPCKADRSHDITERRVICTSELNTKFRSCALNSMDHKRQGCGDNIDPHSTLNVSKCERISSLSKIGENDIGALLLLQKIQSEEDSEWLKREETQMMPNLNPLGSQDAATCSQSTNKSS